MKEGIEEKHESFGNISISRFSGGKGQFFGSDLEHSGGITLTISKASRERMHGTNWIHAKDDLIEVSMTNNQFIYAITSGMNTSGVPCTIHRLHGQCVPQIDHVEDKKEVFSGDMAETYKEYDKRIDDIIELLDGNVGKKKANEIKDALNVLKTHMTSNTNFVMKTFNKSMEKSVTEAKHSIANYIDQKVHSLGVEGLKDQLAISLEPSTSNNKPK